MWPVIVRELQAEARHPFTYWMRILGAGALLLVAAYFFLESGSSLNGGGSLFALLHVILLCSIWVLVPLVTADCISRERREGTLGLLLLTPLTARNIVLAKGLVHGLRAMTLCLAVIPVLALPLLMGGVSWQEALLSATTNFSSFWWAVAAGLLASSWTKLWLRSLVWAMGFSVCFAIVFAFLNCFLLCSVFYPYMRATGFRGSFLSLAQSPSAAVVLATNIGEVWKEIFGKIPRAGQATLLWAGAGTGAVSLAALFLVIQIAAANVRRRWQEEPPSARQLWWQKTFCTPVLWLAFFRRWMRWKLNHNPIGWLEQRTWSARLVTWGWLAIMVCLLGVGVGEVNPSYYRNDFYNLVVVCGWLLAGGMAMSSAGSFRRERENGVLELLLVSPLRVSEIINGRLRGLWGQFMPAIALLVGTWLYLGSAFRYAGGGPSFPILFFAVTFAILPVVGLYYSLRESHFILAFLRTIIAGVVIPLVVGGIASAFWLWLTEGTSRGVIDVWQSRFQLLTILLQLAIAKALRARLHGNLSHRRFAFHV